MIPSEALLVVKLALVAASIWGPSLLARRHGHAVSGALAGLPVIVGPIMAMLLHIVVFANAARRLRWPACLALATLGFVAAATVLARMAWSAPGSVLPCFTLPRHGPQATARLLAGFAHGQSGFVAFFIVLVGLLPHAPPAAAFIAAVAAAVSAPLLLRRWTTSTRRLGRAVE